jgi:hypothetical protein
MAVWRVVEPQTNKTNNKKNNKKNTIIAGGVEALEEWGEEEGLDGGVDPQWLEPQRVVAIEEERDGMSFLLFILLGDLWGWCLFVFACKDLVCAAQTERLQML